MIGPKRLMTAAGCVAGAALVLSPQSHASSPAAWAELFAKASAACTKAANFTGAKVRGQPVDFDEVVLAIVDGRYPQPHMNNASGTVYCLYHKTTGKTQVSESPPAAADAAGAKKKPYAAKGRTCWMPSFGAQLKTPRPIGAACTAKNDEGDSYTGVVRK